MTKKAYGKRIKTKLNFNAELGLAEELLKIVVDQSFFRWYYLREKLNQHSTFDERALFLVVIYTVTL